MHLCGFKGQVTLAFEGLRDFDRSGLDSFTGILQGYVMDRDIGLRGTMMITVDPFQSARARLGVE